MSHLNRRQALRLFAAAGAAGLSAPILSACSPSSDGTQSNSALPGGPPVKIGMIVPLTGMYKDFGNDMDNGFNLYLQLHENKLGNRDVQLIKVDEGDTAEAGKAAAEKLIKESNVLALTGVVNPLTMLALRDTIETAQKPLIGSNASPAALQGVKYIWRTSFVATEPGQAIAEWAAANSGGSLAIVGADNPGGDDEEIRAFSEKFRGAGGTVNGSPRMTPFGGKDFGQVLGQVRNSGATSMFAFYSGTSAIEFVKQFKAARFPSSFKVFAPGSLTEGYVLKQQGDAAQDIYTAMNYSPDLDNATNRRFIADYQKAFGTIPSTYAMASYDAAAVLDKAIGDATRNLDSFTLNAAIGRLGQIDSPRGGWQFSQSRTPLQRWYLRRVRADGAILSNVLTAELKTLG
ncbi:ABC transporter substrate-binding protein [Dactylosporangium sp. AC04546]|uniref:ABC transporter substrate-binding protein n=1 Tax=Dactylosporangium sp. AC04546 TaxID=2862460 RepID=UPI001EDDE6E7|nr:ABC transporter substrate-binding protein [Dactylosporangium sp. AC04546]WVK83745.1 ABC transporter substrate-binding protein [Dactylosporangium sp. AC04546]